VLGFERLGAYTNTLHRRSQAALQAIGFRREGVLRQWHRHGDHVHDVVVWSILRGEFERSALALVPVEVEGAPPAAFVLAEDGLAPAAADDARAGEGEAAQE